MYRRELEIVNEEFLSRDDIYNIRQGGKGGFTVEATKSGRSVADMKLSEMYGVDFRKYLGRLGGSTSFKKHGVSPNFLKSGLTAFSGKSHSEQTKKKISISNKASQLGDRNSQFGSCWVMKDDISKKIRKEYLEQYLEEGYVRGRKISK
jgi:hypothetical protein